jgi:hypothetical protein
MAKENEIELPAVVQGAIEILRDHLDDCNDIGEACEIQEQLEALAVEYDDKGTELAEDEADEQLGG